MVMERIIALIDMDCFYVQVEQRLNPDLAGKPCAVVQYNGWRGGGLIAVNYEARDAGVTRHIRGDDALKICPEIELVRVPEVNGKADLTKYRDAGCEVIDALKLTTSIVERASVDEAYFDLTDDVKEIKLNLQSEPLSIDQLNNTYVVDWEDDDGEQSIEGDKESVRKHGITKLLNLDDDQTINLLIGARIVERMRAEIFKKTGFKCSAGISHNKVLSKLACGINKPNKQTIIPAMSVKSLFYKTPIKKVRNLGGKLGDALNENGIEMMDDILKYSCKELQNKFGEKNGFWLHSLAQGIDNEPVKARQLAQSIGCSKLFTGKSALTTVEKIRQWLEKLATEIEARLQKDQKINNRMATLLNVHANLRDDQPPISRSCPLTSITTERISNLAYKMLSKINKSSDGVSWSPAVVSLGMSASKFQYVEGSSVSFMKNFFQPKSNLDQKDLMDETIVNTLLPSIATSQSSFFSKIKLKSQLSNTSSTGPTPSTSIQNFSSIIKSVESPPDLSDILTSEIEGDGNLLNLKDVVEDEKSNSSVNNHDYYTCDKCQKLISVWDQLEHEDYHLAIQIQTEMDPRANPAPQQPQANSPSTSKRKSKSHHNKGPVIKTRNITSYFQKQEPTNNKFEPK
ncbi:hypothetical protein CHUAL_009760 [Chamberlinius hualienensis]